jgi:hypothetical protein
MFQVLLIDPVYYMASLCINCAVPLVNYQQELCTKRCWQALSETPSDIEFVP